MLIGGAVFGVIAAVKVVKRAIRGEVNPAEKTVKLNEIKNECEHAAAKEYLLGALRAGGVYGDAELEAARKAALKKFPELKSLSFEKGKITDNLWIDCAVRKPAAAVTAGEIKMLMDADGGFYAGEEQPELEIEFYPVLPDEGGAELAKSLEEIKKTLPFASARAAVSPYKKIERTEIILSNGSVINLGDALNIKDKTKTALKILKYVERENYGKFNADFTFYKYGKVYLKHGKK